MRAEPVISEFMAANTITLADNDGAFSDWIEIHNPDPAAINLAGWYLTDSAGNKTKWQFPAVTLPSGGFLVVFASNKNRTDPSAPLHTNFALSAGGEYLGLVKPDGTTVASEFAPSFPEQQDDVSYGLVGAPGSTSPQAGYLLPSPGLPNSAGTSSLVTATVNFSRPPGPFRFSFNLELTGADAGQQIRYVITRGAQAGASAQVTSTSPVYTSPITIDQSTVITAAVYSADGATRGPLSTVHYGKLDANLTSFTTQLPVVVIDSLGSGELVKDGVDHRSWMYVYGSRGPGTSPFSSAAEVITPLTATVRGSSSADFPKRGFNLKLTDEAGDKRAQALLDLPAFEKWALVGAWSFDFSHLNNAFVYSLSNQMGRWAPRTRMVEVFFNSSGDGIDANDYAGIYAITDRIENASGRLDLASLSSKDVSEPAITGGYILKIDPPDADEVAWTTQRGVPGDADSSVVLASPKADDVTPAQLDYIQNYVQRMEDALHADRATGWSQRTYLDYIDRSSWVDHHILNVFAANPDGLVRSAYFHKDRGAKMAAGPVWDFDRAIGSYWDERSFRWDVWSGTGAPDYWRVGWWGIIAEDPEFMQEWVDRWQALRRTELSSANIRTLVDTLAAQVGDEAAQRDAIRWPDNTSPWGTHSATVARMRSWLLDRAKWIDDQFVHAPHFAAANGWMTFTPPAGAKLVYTLDGSDPRSLGGDIAPGAIVHDGPLTIETSANIHARSYRADLRDVFPGTPWSAARGGEASSPLSPASRLVNLSSRAVVGNGDNALIAGVVVADTQAKRYLSRAIGPGLAAFGAAGFVADPQLSIFNAAGSELFRNNGWETGVDAPRLPSYSRAVGAFPLDTGSRDSALASQITAGGYTVQISTPTGQTGVGLAELYELDAKGRTVNLSTRAYVRTDDGVLIGGFVLAGAAHKRMLIRAVGPTLAGFGLNNALLDPILTVYSGSTIVATNDRWNAGDNVDAVTTASTRAGAFALAAGSEDAALLITLPPGPYTVEVKGKAGAEGVALLEIYEIP